MLRSCAPPSDYNKYQLSRQHHYSEDLDTVREHLYIALYNLDIFGNIHEKFDETGKKVNNEFYYGGYNIGEGFEKINDILHTTLYVL